MTNAILYARLEGIRFDIAELQRFVLEEVLSRPATPYRHGDENYEGWALTSRNGSISDYMTRADGTKPNPLAAISPFEATVPTEIHKGIAQDAMESIREFGLTPFRARFLRLKSASYEMGFHHDTLNRKETWRLHIPIFTSPESLFQWQSEDGIVTNVHMSADGCGYLVRVDLLHRAVYNINRPTNTGRIHLVMGLRNSPRIEQVEPLLLAKTKEEIRAKSGCVLDRVINII